MKESTRYALLLFSVLTFITSSYIAINALSDESGPEQDEREENISETEEIINETDDVNDTENNSSNINSTDETSDNEEEPEGILGKAVSGFKLLFSDIGEGAQIIAN